MSIGYTYIEAISKGFPDVDCYCISDGTDYESIVLSAGFAVPTKEELDAWIAAQIKLDMWELIKAERDRRKAVGGYKVGANWFHSDDTSRIQQLGLVMLGGLMPNNIMWKTLGQNFVLMTPALASQIFQAALLSDMTIFAKAEQKRAEMLVSPSPGEYDYLSGWPKIYGE